MEIIQLYFGILMAGYVPILQKSGVGLMVYPTYTSIKIIFKKIFKKIRNCQIYILSLLLNKKL
jgi:hypothetical protein